MYHPTKWFSIHGGFKYSDRHIGSVQGQSSPGDPAPNQPAYEQSNQLKAGTLGFRLKPIKPLTISVDGEIGRENQPIYPISDGNYQAFRARVEYKTKLFRAGVYGKSDYNINSDMLTSYASHARQYGADGSWVPRRGSRSTPATPSCISTRWAESIISCSERRRDRRKLLLRQQYSFREPRRAFHVFETRRHLRRLQPRPGRRRRPGHARGAGIYPPCRAPGGADFPLRYLSPQARLSIRITPKLRWNAGYQYYGYREQFSAAQDYRANTGYSSLAFSF